MHRSAIIASVVFAALACSPALGADCVVDDPTGTPLNVRERPNGQIVSKLGNGRSVEVLAETLAGGKRWFQVAVDGRTLGWVFGNFLYCPSGRENLKSAPMHPRTAPQ